MNGIKVCRQFYYRAKTFTVREQYNYIHYVSKAFAVCPQPPTLVR